MTANPAEFSFMRFAVRGALGLMVLCNLVGCASVPLARREEDSKAKNLQPRADSSLVYLYRDESFGGAILMTVDVNGQRAGETAPDTFFLWELPPGEHVLTSSNSINDRSTLVVNTQPGSVHYVWQEVKMGVLMARPFLQEVDAKKGAAAVKECKLIHAFYAPEERRPVMPAGVIQARAPSTVAPR